MIPRILVLLLLVSASLAQLAPHEGWPVTFLDGGSTVLTHTISVDTTSSGEIIVACGSMYTIALLTFDGEYLEGWPVNTVGYNVNRCGPLLGDVDGDGEIEVVNYQSPYGGDIWNIVVYNLDGTTEQEYEHSYIRSGDTFTELTLANIDNDEALEIICIADSIYAIDNDGSYCESFPRSTHGELAHHASVTVGTAEQIEEPFLTWITAESLYVEYLHADVPLPGWPVLCHNSAADGTEYSSPLVIPQEEGWLIALATEQKVWVWNQDGAMLDGFPYFHDPGGRALIDISAADINGDEVPEILVRLFSEPFRIVTLEGEEIETFRDNLVFGEGGNAETVVFKTSDSDSAYLVGPYRRIAHDSTHVLEVRHYDQLVEGSPALYPQEHGSMYSTVAVFRGPSGMVHCVYNTNMGSVMLWDLDLRGQEIKFEWPMEGGGPTGNRVYDPGEWLNVRTPEESPAVPEQCRIEAAWPNPFNSSISFTVTSAPASAQAIQLFNLLGQEVARVPLLPDVAHQTVTWEGADTHHQPLPSGVYFARLPGAYQPAERILLLR